MMEHELRPVQADIDDAYFEYGKKHQKEARTMIKDIKVVQCDVCGRIEPAAWNYSQREDTGWYEEPKGWHKSPGNAEMILCPACWEKLNDKR